MFITIRNYEGEILHREKDAKFIYTQYQPLNGHSHWIFIQCNHKKEYAVEYDPETEYIVIS